MKTTNVKGQEMLAALAKAEETGKLGYAIAKNRRKLETELREYLAAVGEILQKYGTPGEKGTFKIKADVIQDYIAERKPLDEMECSFDETTVDEETFTNGNLTSQQMFDLDWMVVK